MGTKKTLRKRSRQEIAGLPLVDIAMGPDEDSGEELGRARGIIALGDEA